MRRIGAVAILLLLTGTAAHVEQTPAIIANVRAAIAQKNFALGDQLIAASRATYGVTPELLEALSWLGRGALDIQQRDRAERYAQQTYDLAVAELKRRPVDRETHLPIALGAAIEVLARASVERGGRTDAIAYLRQQLAKFQDTSLQKRIQKNINLLSLEGKPAPALDLSEHLETALHPLAADKGSVVLLFFWAHWCSDCKAQGPVLEKLLTKYGRDGLKIVAPTQRFGYVAGGKPAGPAEETAYIQQIQRASYPWMAARPVPLSESNHKRYGVSTTPTLVLVDRAGLIRLYHPGQMTEAELDPLIKRLVSPPAQRRTTPASKGF